MLVVDDGAVEILLRGVLLRRARVLRQLDHELLEAAQSCNDIPGLNGHLAVFPDDFQALFQYMPYVFPVAADFTLFIGLQRQGPIVADDPDKNWFWVFPNGSRNPLGPGFWIEDQPDQSTISGTKNFGVFMRRGSSFGLGAHDSSHTDGYICQYGRKYYEESVIIFPGEYMCLSRPSPQKYSHNAANYAYIKDYKIKDNIFKDNAFKD